MKTRVVLPMWLVFISLVLSGCGSIQLSGPTSTPMLPSPTPTTVKITPKAGEWTGTAEFGTFIFSLDSDGSSIKKIDYNFTALECSGMTHSGGIGIEFTGGKKIGTDESQINIQTDLSMDPFASNKELLIIGGSFNPDGETASGQWTDLLGTTVCNEGVWTASVNVQ